MMSDLQDAQDARSLAETRLATVRASTETRAMESALLLEGMPRFATGDPRLFTDANQYGDAPRSYQQWAGILDSSILSNRENGRYQPFYLDETDLGRKRAEWRNIGAFSSVAVGANESRKNYVLGSGYTFTAQATNQEQDDQQAAAVQQVLDQFLEDNNFSGTLDAEIYDRASEDGEVFLGLYPREEGCWRTTVRIIEPEQVTEPLRTKPIENWLGLEGVNYWWHGIHTQAIRLAENAWIDNTANPIGYHVVYDSTGELWDYLDAAHCHHIKRNTPINARRGVSDYMPVLHDIELETKLRKNTGEGAAIQAAIAFIKEHPAGVSQSTVEAINTSLSTGSYDRPTQDGSIETNTRKFNSGTILDVGQTKYHAGPIGSLRSGIFIEVAGYLLRSIGVRWNMPEYMISADASNANYASTLVSESPFVKSREREQRFYKQHFKQIAWKSIRLAWEAKRFGGVDWESLQRTVAIEIEVPDVATRDRMANAQEKQILSAAGVISKQTWASEAGYDYEEERGRIEEEPKPEQPAGMPQLAESLDARLERAAELLWEGYP